MEGYVLQLGWTHSKTLVYSSAHAADTQRRVFFHLPVSIQLAASVRRRQTAVFIGQGSTLSDGSVEATAHMCRVWPHSAGRELMSSVQTAPLQINTCNKSEETLAHMRFL